MLYSFLFSLYIPLPLWEILVLIFFAIFISLHFLDDKSNTYLTYKHILLLSISFNFS